MMKRTALWTLMLALLCAMLCAHAAADKKKADEAFFRMDLDSKEAWSGELLNLRLLTKGQYKFGKTMDKYKIDPNYVPSAKGLNRLNISGSAQYSEQQFRKLAKTLRKLAKGKKIYVIDLRQESHAFLNGNPVSWYKRHNWANYGKTLDEVRQDEAERFGSLVGQTITAYSAPLNEKSRKTSIKVKSCMTEEELVTSEGFGYLRIPAPDLSWPPEEQIDAFIDFVKGIDMKRSWLHFHCHAGTGRTGVFMMLYDKMKNPEVSIQDIILRQTLTGSEYPLYRSGKDNLQGRLYDEKAELTPLLFKYVEQHYKANYAVSWSDWLLDQTE